MGRGRSVPQEEIQEIRTMSMIKNETEMVKVRIGKFGSLGDGKRRCPYFGKSSGLSYFSSRPDVNRDFATATCWNTSGIITVALPAYENLGYIVAHEVTNPEKRSREHVWRGSKQFQVHFLQYVLFLGTSLRPRRIMLPENWEGNRLDMFHSLMIYSL